ncbi:Pentatricopeptide repeat-containing protein [Heracleum sosnowskyi]|uniref:Pentatricopeptide repeat-containing protein n=1 Tax=Heracleum sosnowskyi TaxID=360622 RepID=A0AAD8H117_9APIA|nr:Pentatricopeptide repeat-containing protein [Heracleum sosnowskyi]
MGKIIVFCAVSDRGSMDYATSVFKNVDSPDGFMWNTMIRGFVRTMQVENVFEYFKKMQENGEKPDNFAFCFLIKVSGQLGSVLLGKQIHCSVVKHGFEDHVFVRNTLIHLYGLLKEIDIAQQLFEEMCSRNVVTWNVIIDCHVTCGNYNEGLGLFSRMRGCGVNFDDVTLVAVLAACSALGNLDFGRWIRRLVDNAGLGRNVMVLNSLIDMYAKCGQVAEAHKIFDESKERNLVTWNSMILGLATNGHASEALELFSTLLTEKLQTPNDVTFLGVLCACSHGGMVEKGRQYFDLMTKEYGIKPNIQHYGCVVDMLGRAGFVDEAYHFIKNMPLKCNAIVWRTLLAACRVHNNVELGEVVRRHLLELEPDHSSDYVLLVNMYAGAGQWRDVMNERHSMRARGVQKPMPGNSIVGIPL